MSNLTDITTISKIAPTLYEGIGDSVITRFPNELLAEIFVVSTQAPIRVPPPLQDSDLPWAFLRVSKKWREVALATPDLWNDVCLDYDQGSPLLQAWEIMEAQYMLEKTVAAEKILERTKGSIISLEIRVRSFYDREKWRPRIFHLVNSASSSLKTLTINLSFDDLDAFFQLGGVSFPSLEFLSIDDGHAVNAIDMLGLIPDVYQITLLQNAPRLRRLFLGANIPWKENATALNWARLNDLTLRVTRLPVEKAHMMLRLCPNLVSLRITPGTMMTENTAPVDNPVHLPLLTKLAVEFWVTDEVPIFLQPLVVPCLRHLSITYIHVLLEPDADTLLIPILAHFTHLESLACHQCVPVEDIRALLAALPWLRKLILPSNDPLPEAALPELAEGTLLPSLEGLSCTVRPESLKAHLKMLQDRAACPGGATRISGIFDWPCDRGGVSLEDAHGAMDENAQLISMLQQDGLLELVPLGTVVSV